MEILRETTKSHGWTFNKDYIFSSGRILAYRPCGTKRWNMLSRPMSFNKRGRTFKALNERLPSGLKTQGKKVVGSKGDIYYVHEGKCTCPGFTYRGNCKHV